MVQSYSPGGANVPSYEGTLAPPVEYDWTCASFGQPTTQTANRSVESFLDRSRQSVVRHIGATLWIRLNSCFLRPTRVHNPNYKSISSTVFAQITAGRPYTLQWASISPKIASSHRKIWISSNLWFLWLIWTHNPNGISIGSAVFAGFSCSSLVRQTDRPTDRPTGHATRSVTIGRIYVVLRCGLIILHACHAACKMCIVRCILYTDTILAYEMYLHLMQVLMYGNSVPGLKLYNCQRHCCWFVFGSVQCS